MGGDWFAEDVMLANRVSGARGEGRRGSAVSVYKTNATLLSAYPVFFFFFTNDTS